jgi:hypothetical protein|tara:strand:- start:2259 stop:2642 length:384 start_codon:yes stop_codon:yes gene_type:complete
MPQALKFHNFSDEDLTFKWDGDTYEVKAGEPMLLPDYLAKHACKNLVNREIQKVPLMQNGEQVKIHGQLQWLNTDHFSRSEFEARCFPDEEIIEAKSDIQLGVEMANAKKKKIAKKTKEVEFEGLKK